MQFGGVTQATMALKAAIFCLFSTMAGGVNTGSLGHLIVTAPKDGKVSYIELPANGVFGKPIELVSKGLHHPQGVAIDHKRKRLFVADPDVQKIYAYQLVRNGNALTTDGKQIVISDKAESRWVAVDGTGNVFFSDEPKNQILKVSADRILRGNKEPEIVYDDLHAGQVSKPGGVAVDNFHVYWTNKHFGTTAGTVVKGWESPNEAPKAAGEINLLAQNLPKSYGVCLAMNNVFYTDSEQRVYGVKKNGGEAAEVTSSFSRPRGCVWDGDGTVYVADRGNGAVYSFFGNMQNIAHADISKAFDFEDAFGLALLQSAANSRSWTSFIALALSLLASAVLLQSV